MRRQLAWLAALSSSLLSGCSSHYIRDGVWELAIHVERSDNREPLVIPSREVMVKVESINVPGKPEIKEEAELSPLPPPAGGAGSGQKDALRLELKPMYADIEHLEERDPMIKIQHQEPPWHFQMSGVVKDSETVVGTRVIARILHVDPPALFEGTWSMRWLRDE
ncbi:MAG TPA: hypothetical protein VMT52_18390 [Planctomycetota bacterium]|nr:hypothetical protein [Planctomycetota bacterium]